MPRYANDSATRARVLDLVTACPGITKTELCKLTGLGWGTIFHHVRVLSRSGAVCHQFSSRRVFLYARSQAEGQLLHMRLLRDEVSTLILMQVQAKPGTGIQEVSQALRMSRKTIRRCMMDLVASGLLAKTDDYRPKFEVATPWLSLAMPAGLPVQRSLDEAGTNQPSLQDWRAPLGRP